MPGGYKVTVTDKQTKTVTTYYCTTGTVDDTTDPVWKKFTGKRDGETTVGTIKIREDGVLDQKVEAVSVIP